jgi:hypothetical protein
MKTNKTFNLLIHLLLVFTSISCCSEKCNESINSAVFRIASAANGQDLVFGAGKIYNKDSIKFYSINGTDTIFHHYLAATYSNAIQDSLLFVSFDYRKKATVFVRLTNADTDTLNLIYDVRDSRCCPDYSRVIPNSYNYKPVQLIDSGITLLKK